MARPLTWTSEKIKEYKQKILNDISIKGLSLRKTLRQKDYPTISVFLSWINEDKEFAIQYARACESRADAIFDDILEICDATAEDVIYDDEGNEITNHNIINRDRLRVDARKWMLAKMNPKKYGDKVDVTTDGEKINTPVSEIISGFFAKDPENK